MFAVNFDRTTSVTQQALNTAQGKLATSLKRLSTGLRITSAQDDPSGLISSESFKSNDAALATGISNATRAGNIVGTAESALGEVGSLLTGLQSLVAAAASTGAQTQDERDASQAEVDTAIAQINKVSSSSSFNGKKLLDGSLSYKTTGVVAASLTDVNVNSAKVPVGSSKAINVAVQAAATRGTVIYAAGTLAAGNNVSLELTGNTGTQQVSLAAGSTIAQQAAVINATTNDTGVQATVNGTNLQIESGDFGSTQSVSAKVLSGTYATSATSASGTDASVRINGALATANGLKVSYRDNSTDLNFVLTAVSNVAAAATSFNVTGGGADFQIGSRVTEANRVSIGINSVAATSLGNSTVGFLNTLKSGEANALNSGNLSGAQKIADAAVKQVATLRGRLGLFQKYSVQSSINSLQSEADASGEAGSAIRDTDFAKETAEVTRQQVLQQAAQSAFAIASQRPSQALSLLSSIR